MSPIAVSVSAVFLGTGYFMSHQPKIYVKGINFKRDYATGRVVFAVKYDWNYDKVLHR